ncbi:S-layer homology domain-containing protein [Heyndrickxia oleronia]|uniref:S-layer homology domain-containing protein n=1 Tax=Heyndrickxia oleronia TaxID=38875 RepID=UPI001FF0093B|nr:S-layer homology domain-containing protein [Heyndrickxia oleronia]
MKAGNWATPYIQTAYANGLIKGVTASKFDPSAPIKRGDLAILLHRADSKFGDVIGNNFPGVELVKATNNTTVEVTFKNAVDAKDVQAAKFSIEGLTVSNAAVKQTDSKTVVLTTSAQEAGKLYTVKSGSATLGKFKGASAVIPTGVNVVEKSIQGVLGQEVTVKASVTVKDGESKAGIPVTFNVTGENQLNAPQVVETTTDENGVATYSYTRYANTTDTVTAYATGDRTKFSTGTVYWAAAKQLTVKDITEGTSLVNGSKKVYEINSAANAGKYVFVTFKENLNVTPDKAVSGAKVEGLTTYAIDASGHITNTVPAGYPYEYTTGGKAVTAVKLDNNGKANLVVSGSNAEVTPIVFVSPYKTNTSGNLTDVDPYSARALQAQASTVKFELKHELGLTIKAEGVQNAATYKNSVETGGRDYTVTYTDKNGKAAAPGTKVKVAIDTTGVKGTLHVLDSDGNEIAATSTVGSKKYYDVKVEKDGKALFTVASTNVNDYVSPVAFIDNGKSTGNGVLDTDDLQAQGEITYFVADVTYTAALSAVDKDGKPVTAVLANGSEYADFVYSLVDQNGKPRAASNDTTVTFEVKAGTGAITADTTKVEPGQTKTVDAIIVAGSTKASVRVVAQNPSSATVKATGSRAGVVLPSTDPASVTVNFSQYGTAPVTGTVTAYDTTLEVITINNVVYSYATGSYQYNGNGITKSAFEGYLKQGRAVVSITKDGDNFTYNIISAGNDITASSVFTESVAAAAATKASGTYTNAANSLTVESAAGATEYNDVKVVFEKNSTSDTGKVETSYANKVLTVKLPTVKDVVNGTVSIDTANATFENVETAIEAFNKSALTVTLTGLTGDASELVGKSIDLAGAKKEVTSKDSTLVVTFSQAVDNVDADFTSITVGKGATTASFNLNGAGESTATLSADKKKLTITLIAADEATVKANDNITAVSTIKAPTGKSISDLYPITIVK